MPQILQDRFRATDIDSKNNLEKKKKKKKKKKYIYIYIYIYIYNCISHSCSTKGKLLSTKMLMNKILTHHPTCLLT